VLIYKKTEKETLSALKLVETEQYYSNVKPLVIDQHERLTTKGLQRTLPDTQTFFPPLKPCREMPEEKAPPSVKHLILKIALFLPSQQLPHFGLNYIDCNAIFAATRNNNIGIAFGRLDKL